MPMKALLISKFPGLQPLFYKCHGIQHRVPYAAVSRTNCHIVLTSFSLYPLSEQWPVCYEVVHISENPSQAEVPTSPMALKIWRNSRTSRFWKKVIFPFSKFQYAACYKMTDLCPCLSLCCRFSIKTFFCHRRVRVLVSGFYNRTASCMTEYGLEDKQKWMQLTF